MFPYTSGAPQPVLQRGKLETVVTNVTANNVPIMPDITLHLTGASYYVILLDAFGTCLYEGLDQAPSPGTYIGVYVELTSVQSSYASSSPEPYLTGIYPLVSARALQQVVVPAGTYIFKANYSLQMTSIIANASFYAQALALPIYNSIPPSLCAAPTSGYPFARQVTVGEASSYDPNNFLTRSSNFGLPQVQDTLRLDLYGATAFVIRMDLLSATEPLFPDYTHTDYSFGNVLTVQTKVEPFAGIIRASYSYNLFPEDHTCTSASLLVTVRPGTYFVCAMVSAYKTQGNIDAKLTFRLLVTHR